MYAPPTLKKLTFYYNDFYHHNSSDHESWEVILYSLVQHWCEKCNRILTCAVVSMLASLRYIHIWDCYSTNLVQEETFPLIPHNIAAAAAPMGLFQYAHLERLYWSKQHKTMVDCLETGFEYVLSACPNPTTFCLPVRPQSCLPPAISLPWNTSSLSSPIHIPHMYWLNLASRTYCNLWHKWHKFLAMFYPLGEWHRNALRHFCDIPNKWGLVDTPALET